MNKKSSKDYKLFQQLVNEFYYDHSQNSENNITNSKNKKTKSNGFAKTVAVPFLSGVLGAGIVLGTCFGIPEIKENIIGSNKATTVTTNSTSTSSQINTTQISLEKYSETGMAVAAKVGGFDTFCDNIELDNYEEMETSASEIAKKLNKVYYSLDADSSSHLYLSLIHI